MKPIFSAPLMNMVRPENRVYVDEHPVGKITNGDLFKQLEGPWSGIEALSYVRQRAFHQLTARATRAVEIESKWSFMLMGTPSVDEDDDGCKMVVIKPEHDKPTASSIQFDDKSLKLISDLAGRHAYLATVTLALIRKAKETSGILPSSDFLWTREKDPHFWRIINGYGRPNHLASVVGVFAHFDFEQKLQAPSLTTYFDQCEIQDPNGE